MSICEKKELKLLLSVDMEGISGIVHQDQTGGDPSEYERGRALMVGDVNSAIEGIFEVCEADVYVSDAHGKTPGGMGNIKSEDLHESARLIKGSPKPLTQMEGISSDFNAVLFIGYHSKKGTERGILDHTISSGTIDSISINGVEVGETAINAAIAGYFNVPLIFLSGDLAVTEEAKQINPNIITVAVKEAVSRTAANCLNPKKSRKLIKDGVMVAIKQISSFEPFRFTAPISVEIKFVNSLMVDAIEFMPFVRRIDGRTVSYVIDDYIKAYKAIWACILIASQMLET